MQPERVRKYEWRADPLCARRLRLRGLVLIAWRVGVLVCTTQDQGPAMTLHADASTSTIVETGGQVERVEGGDACEKVGDEQLQETEDRWWAWSTVVGA